MDKRKVPDLRTADTTERRLVAECSALVNAIAARWRGEADLRATATMAGQLQRALKRLADHRTQVTAMRGTLATAAAADDD